MAFTRARRQEPCRHTAWSGINPGRSAPNRHVTLLKTAPGTSSATNPLYEFRRVFRSAVPRMRAKIGGLMGVPASDRSGYTRAWIYTVDGGISAGWG